jgi:type IV fimbrial biogenesis protein FimT
VVSVVGTFAVGMNGVIQHHRLSAEVNQLIADIHLTRSEAIKRSDTVTLCMSNTGNDCTRTSEWRYGWIVFTDINSNQRVDTGEVVLRVQSPLQTGVRLNFAGALNRDHYLTYKSSGYVEPNGTFTFCENSRATPAKAIIVLGTGRARISSKGANGAALRCS